MSQRGQRSTYCFRRCLALIICACLLRASSTPAPFPSSSYVGTMRHTTMEETAHEAHKLCAIDDAIDSALASFHQEFENDENPETSTQPGSTEPSNSAFNTELGRLRDSTSERGSLQSARAGGSALWNERKGNGPKARGIATEKELRMLLADVQVVIAKGQVLMDRNNLVEAATQFDGARKWLEKLQEDLEHHGEDMRADWASMLSNCRLKLAACSIRLGQYDSAAAYCGAVLKKDFDPIRSGKAFYSRGVARRGIAQKMLREVKKSPSKEGAQNGVKLLSKALKDIESALNILGPDTSIQETREAVVHELTLWSGARDKGSDARQGSEGPGSDWDRVSMQQAPRGLPASFRASTVLRNAGYDHDEYVDEGDAATSAHSLLRTQGAATSTDDSTVGERAQPSNVQESRQADELVQYDPEFDQSGWKDGGLGVLGSASGARDVYESSKNAQTAQRREGLAQQYFGAPSSSRGKATQAGMSALDSAGVDTAASEWATHDSCGPAGLPPSGETWGTASLSEISRAGPDCSVCGKELVRKEADMCGKELVRKEADRASSVSEMSAKLTPDRKKEGGTQLREGLERWVNSKKQKASQAPVGSRYLSGGPNSSGQHQQHLSLNAAALAKGLATQASVSLNAAAFPMSKLVSQPSLDGEDTDNVEEMRKARASMLDTVDRLSKTAGAPAGQLREAKDVISIARNGIALSMQDVSQSDGTKDVNEQISRDIDSMKTSLTSAVKALSKLSGSPARQASDLFGQIGDAYTVAKSNNSHGPSPLDEHRRPRRRSATPSRAQASSPARSSAATRAGAKALSPPSTPTATIDDVALIAQNKSAEVSSWFPTTKTSRNASMGDVVQAASSGVVEKRRSAGNFPSHTPGARNVSNILRSGKSTFASHLPMPTLMEHVPSQGSQHAAPRIGAHAFEYSGSEFAGGHAVSEKRLGEAHGPEQGGKASEWKASRIAGHATDVAKPSLLKVPLASTHVGAHVQEPDTANDRAQTAVGVGTEGKFSQTSPHAKGAGAGTTTGQRNVPKTRATPHPSPAAKSHVPAPGPAPGGHSATTVPANISAIRARRVSHERTTSEEIVYLPRVARIAHPSWKDDPLYVDPKAIKKRNRAQQQQEKKEITRSYSVDFLNLQALPTDMSAEASVWAEEDYHEESSALVDLMLQEAPPRVTRSHALRTVSGRFPSSCMGSSDDEAPDMFTPSGICIPSLAVSMKTLLSGIFNTSGTSAAETVAFKTLQRGARDVLAIASFAVSRERLMRPRKLRPVIVSGAETSRDVVEKGVDMCARLVNSMFLSVKSGTSTSVEENETKVSDVALANEGDIASMIVTSAQQEDRAAKVHDVKEEGTHAVHSIVQRFPDSAHLSEEGDAWSAVDAKKADRALAEERKR